MPQRSPSLIDPKVAQAVATLGTKKATHTAQAAAAKTVHTALLISDSRASVKEMITAAQDIAVALKAHDPSVVPGLVAVAMKGHFIKTGDLVVPKPKNAPAGAPSDPDTGQAAALHKLGNGANARAQKGGLRQLYDRVRGWVL